MQARVVIFGTQVDNDELYCEIANQPSDAYSFLYLSNFPPFNILNNKSFRQTMQARVIIFGMQVDNDVLYRGIANRPSPSYSFLYLSDFLSFHTLNDEFFRQRFRLTVQTRVSYLVCRWIMMNCIVRLRTSLLMLILLCISPVFFLSIF